MSHNYTKRIENRIKLVKGKYVLSTHKIFVPNKGSKIFFRQVEVDPINKMVTICGTPPALKRIKEIYKSGPMTALFTSECLNPGPEDDGDSDEE